MHWLGKFVISLMETIKGEVMCFPWLSDPHKHTIIAWKHMIFDDGGPITPDVGVTPKDTKLQ